MSSDSTSLVRWALPIGLFVVAIGGIAWLAQNLPKGTVRKSDPPPASPAPVETQAPLKFAVTRAVWDETDPEYLKECEAGNQGWFDFPFSNPTGSAVLLGFAHSSCDCSRLEATILGPEWTAKIAAATPNSPFPSDPAWSWTTLEQNGKTEVEVPAGGAGVVRLRWNGRKNAGESLRLNVRVWMHPVGRPDERAFENLIVPIVMTDPLRFERDRLSLGVIGPGGQARGELWAWSATRDSIELKVDAAKLPANLEASVEKLDAAAVKAFEARLRSEKRNTRVQSAYRIAVALREQKGESQLDQGPFRREIPLIAADVPQGVASPMVTAAVKGDVEIGLPEDGGAVQLKTFPAKSGVTRSVSLWCDGDGDLVVDSVYPSILDVALKRNAKDSTAGRSKWTLVVVVPAGAWFGSMPEDAAIVIRSGASSARKIRVPIVGVGVQG